jgi:mRNA interferase MazF
MPTTTGYEFGDLALVPFPFTDQRASKRRPAVVVSSERYHQERQDLIILAVTSHVGTTPAVGEATIANWSEAGLLKPSALKPLLATIARGLVLRKLGRLEGKDRQALRTALDEILGH